MPTHLTPPQLDEILAFQLTIAWAGESAGDPPRLGWWRTDLVDLQGGGDLFSRLVPKTSAWAGVLLVRDAARAIDRAARALHLRGDWFWTPFHLGFTIDEALADRLAYHRQQRHEPSVLGSRFAAGSSWSKAKLEASLRALGTPKFEDVPNGRKVSARGASPAEAFVLLCAALLPLGASYPLPFIEVDG